MPHMPNLEPGEYMLPVNCPKCGQSVGIRITPLIPDYDLVVVCGGGLLPADTKRCLFTWVANVKFTPVVEMFRVEKKPLKP